MLDVERSQAVDERLLAETSADSSNALLLRPKCSNEERHAKAREKWCGLGKTGIAKGANRKGKLVPWQIFCDGHHLAVRARGVEVRNREQDAYLARVCGCGQRRVRHGRKGRELRHEFRESISTASTDFRVYPVVGLPGPVPNEALLSSAGRCAAIISLKVTVYVHDQMRGS